MANPLDPNKYQIGMSTAVGGMSKSPILPALTGTPIVKPPVIPTTKPLAQMTVAEAQASGQSDAYNKLVGGYSTPNTQALVNNPIDVNKLTTGGSTYNPPKTSVPNQTGVGVNALGNKEPIQTPTETTPDKAQALMDKLLSTDVATQKADLRAKADLQAKNQEYNTALADYKNRKTAYEDQIEEIRKNPEGKMRGALEYEVQELQRKANKDLANMAIGVELMQNNYIGAEKILNDQIADIQTSYDNDVKKFQLGMDFLRNDMTESEKLKASQAFEEKQMKAKFDLDEINAQKDFIRQKSLLSYKAELDGSGAGTTTSISNEVNKIFENKEANTPAVAKTVLAQLAGSKAISSGTRARMAPAVEVLNSLDELANSNLEGKFTGMGGFLGFAKLKEGVKGIFNAKSKEAITNQQQIDAVNLKVQQWASGASLTKQQTDQVNKMTPTSWDSDRTIRAKTSQLYNFMLNQAEGNLLTEGVNVQFPAVNLFEIQDLYEKASPEQKKVIEQTYFNKK